MRNPELNARPRRHIASGFSLIEMLIVVAISLVVTVVSVMSLVPMLKQQRVNNAYNITLSALRLARDSAVSERVAYSVTFSSSATPNTIVVAPVLATGGTAYQGQDSSVTYQLPSDVKFYAPTAAPTYPSPGPDNFGTGALPVDFGHTANGSTASATVIYFCPDGSSQDAEGTGGNCVGSWDGGVVYVSRVGEITSARAISVIGATGRIRGWRLYNVGGTYTWVRQ
jgi:prepilin-type N-terminal cleavage/methylation domain-containing protein